MDPTIRQTIIQFLDSHRIMSVATVRADGWPQATAVGFVNEGLSIYFLCGLESQKAQNLARDDRVSLTINDDPEDVMQITGLSLSGHARLVEDPAEAARLIALSEQGKNCRYPGKPTGELAPCNHASFDQAAAEEAIETAAAVLRWAAERGVWAMAGHSTMAALAAAAGSP